MRKKVILLVACIMIVAIGTAACGDKNRNSMSGSDETETKKNDKATVEAEESNKSEKLSYDFSADVEKGLLYSKEDGKIADKNGNVISEYDYITVLENGGLSDGENIMDGYTAGTGGKIVQSIPEPADFGNMGEDPDDLKHTWREGLTYDFATDVANGKLYALDNGDIGTKDEISIPEYADFKVMDRGWFSIGGIDVTCFHVEDDSKITIQKNEITGDMQTDAKNCLLYINDTNQIVDSGGNIIPDYQDFHMTERGGIADEYSMIEGYFVLSGMVLFQIPEAVEYSDETQEGNSNLGKPMNRAAISDIGLVSWSYGNDARKSLMSFLNGKTVNVTTARQMQNKAEAISKRPDLSAADIGLAQLISTIAGMLEGDATADSNRENYIQYYDALNSYMGTY